MSLSQRECENGTNVFHCRIFMSQHMRFWYLLHWSNKGSDNLAHMSRLTRVFAVSIHKVWMQVKIRAKI